MKNWKIVALLIVFFILAGCGEPPEDVEEINLIQLIHEQILTVNKIKDDDEKMLEYFKFLTNNFQAVIAFNENSTIYIQSKKAEPGENDFVYSLDHNQYMTTRPIYVTALKKETLFSFDNKTWYSSISDANKEIQGIRNDFVINSRLEGDNLYIDYKMALSLGKKPKLVELDEKRDVIDLKKGMVFSHQEEERVNMDLRDKILFVPANTLLSGNVMIDGNLIKSQTKNKDIVIKSVKSLYFYVNKRKFSISFDKKNWNPNILSFQIEPEFLIAAVENDHVFFNVTATANFYKDTISMSVVNLLFRMF